MAAKSGKTPEAAVDELAGSASPEDIDKVDRQFSEKLRRLRESGKAKGEMLERLEVMWAMLKAPGEIVPWRDKALIMAAISYFVSPLDVIPDIAGKVGLMDDARVVEIVWGRIEDARNAFKSGGDKPKKPAPD